MTEPYLPGLELVDIDAAYPTTTLVASPVHVLIGFPGAQALFTADPETGFITVTTENDTPHRFDADEFGALSEYLVLAATAEA